MRIDKSIFPNTLTFANLVCGVISVEQAFHGNYFWAAIFILLAALADRYDGKVARYLKVPPTIGKQLDSLADLISFGMAPGVLAFQMHNFIDLGIIGYALMCLFPVAGAYRLARFNITEFDGEFYGIPITFAGLFMAVYGLIHVYFPLPAWLTIILIVVLSYLMVCTHRFKKF